MNIFFIFITFLYVEIQCYVAKMMKMWDIATSYQGGRGLSSFVETMNAS